LRERELAVIPEPETGFFGDLTGGFASGVVGIGESAALGAATLLDEQEELAARSRIQSAANALRPSFGDEEDLTYKIGQTFGSIAGFIGAGAAVTYGAGAAGLGAAGAGIAGLLGAGTLGVGAATGEASERARAFGATEEERNRAIRQAIPVGASEALPLRRILGKLTGDLGEEVVQGFRNRVVSALRTGGEEAAQEAAAGIAQNLIERGYNIDQACSKVQAKQPPSAAVPVRPSKCLWTCLLVVVRPARLRLRSHWLSLHRPCRLPPKGKRLQKSSA
jgi:hypothetical protein